MGQPCNRVRFTRTSRVLDEIIFADSIFFNGTKQFPYTIKLMEPREYEYLPLTFGKALILVIIFLGVPLDMQIIMDCSLGKAGFPIPWPGKWTSFYVY